MAQQAFFKSFNDGKYVSPELQHDFAAKFVSRAPNGDNRSLNRCFLEAMERAYAIFSPSFSGTLNSDKSWPEFTEFNDALGALIDAAGPDIDLIRMSIGQLFDVARARTISPTQVPAFVFKKSGVRHLGHGLQTIDTMSYLGTRLNHGRSFSVVEPSDFVLRSIDTCIWSRDVNMPSMNCLAPSHVELMSEREQSMLEPELYLGEQTVCYRVSWCTSAPSFANNNDDDDEEQGEEIGQSVFITLDPAQHKTPVSIHVKDSSPVDTVVFHLVVPHASLFTNPDLRDSLVFCLRSGLGAILNTIDSRVNCIALLTGSPSRTREVFDPNQLDKDLESLVQDCNANECENDSNDIVKIGYYGCPEIVWCAANFSLSTVTVAALHAKSQFISEKFKHPLFPFGIVAYPPNDQISGSQRVTYSMIYNEVSERVGQLRDVVSRLNDQLQVLLGSELESHGHGSNAVGTPTSIDHILATLSRLQFESTPKFEQSKQVMASQKIPSLGQDGVCREPHFFTYPVFTAAETSPCPSEAFAELEQLDHSETTSPAGRSTIVFESNQQLTVMTMRSAEDNWEQSRWDRLILENPNDYCKIEEFKDQAFAAQPKLYLPFKKLALDNATMDEIVKRGQDFLPISLGCTYAFFLLLDPPHKKYYLRRYVKLLTQQNIDLRCYMYPLEQSGYTYASYIAASAEDTIDFDEAHPKNLYVLLKQLREDDKTVPRLFREGRFYTQSDIDKSACKVLNAAYRASVFNFMFDRIIAEAALTEQDAFNWVNQHLDSIGANTKAREKAARELSGANRPLGHEPEKKKCKRKTSSKRKRVANA